jgi:general secretion pathway protein A
MYETFYQLSADPFRLSPDPEFSFEHRTYRKALTYMHHALHRAEGFIMITGQPGTGKTTLVTDLVRTLSVDQVAVARLVSTQLPSSDLLDLVAYSFDLDPEGWSKAKVLVQVERFLKQQYHQGRRSLLIVDEAQDMDEDALEELRLLTNMLIGNHQLLQVFLVGQEQLRDTVNTPALEQLQQRMIAATFLEPLDTDDTRTYIKHRLRCVQWKGDPLISTQAYAMIRHCSHGIPRRINQICSRLFLHGSIEEKHRLGTEDLEIVVGELRQESLLPMDQESINEAVPWSAEQFVETYEEEPQTSPPSAKTVLPTIENPPGTERAVRPSPMQVADTQLRIQAREPVSFVGPGPGTDNNHADIDHIKCQALFSAPGSYASNATRLLCNRISKVGRPVMWSGSMVVTVLITAILAAYFSNSHIGSPASDLDAWAQNQGGTQQPIESAVADSGTTSIQTLPKIPATEEPDSSDSVKRASDVGDITREGGEVLTVFTIEADQNPVQEHDSMETSHPASRSAMVDPDTTPAPEDTGGETTTQSESGQQAPAAAQEVAPVMALLQDNQPKEDATPITVKEFTMATPLTDEEKIAELLDLGLRSLRRYRLLFPKDDNAYHYYQQVLKMDPENSSALYGIKQIVTRYTSLAANALDKNNKKKAGQYIARGFRISPNDEGLQALRDRMNAPPVEIAPQVEIAPPIEIAPEPKSGSFFMRLKQLFTQQSNEQIEERVEMGEP